MALAAYEYKLTPVAWAWAGTNSAAPPSSETASADSVIELDFVDRMTKLLPCLTRCVLSLRVI
jgi:hypothetical protein